MKKFLFATAMALSAGFSTQAADLKSGPQAGEAVPGAFEPFNITGSAAGEESCLFCRFGKDPVVMVFARSQSEGLTKLIGKLEKEIVAKKTATNYIGSAVIYLDTSDKIKSSSKKIAEDGKLKEIILACIKPSDIEEDYKLAKDADVTVLLYSARNVKANFTFKAGEITDAAADKVIADLPKILPAK